MNSQDQIKLMASQLGIADDQIVTSGDNSFPDYFTDCRIQAQDDIVNMLSGDLMTIYDAQNTYWTINAEILEVILKTYKIVSSYRIVTRRLGTCDYRNKVIRMNFGHQKMDEKQCYKTLVHEYIHAIVYTVFGENGHGDLFKFYLSLIYKRRNQPSILAPDLARAIARLSKTGYRNVKT